MEDRWNPRRTTVFRWLALFGAVALWTFRACGAIGGSDFSTATLTWEPSPDLGIIGYRLYQGTASRDYSVLYDVGDATNVTVGELEAGRVYFFAATAYDTIGLESDFSSELVYTNSYPPSSIQITDLIRNPDGNFSINGVATPAQTCVLLGATNLTPLVSWMPLATNVASAEGAFAFTDLQATNYPRRFYQVRQPAP